MTGFAAEELRAHAAALLNAGGYARGHAERTAEVLIWANLRGTDSHGVLRIPRYVEMVEQGIIDPVAEPELASQDGAVAVLEAARAPGPSAMTRSMDEAVRIAERLGIGWCSARGITHAGAVGYYALRAARQGHLGIAMTASGPLMAYHGARVAGLSTNPISIAAPSSGEPLLLDMSTSTVALGKLMQARDAGRSIPEGWAIGADGAPATDPAEASTLTPLGGPKGSGLSLMIEVLCSVLVSNPVISSVLSGGEGAMNGAALAIRVGSFADPALFAEQVAELAGRLKALPKAPGTEEILMPGERGFRTARTRERDGIPLTHGTVRRLRDLAERLGVPPLADVPAAT